MATTVTKQTLHDGERNLVVKVNFVGDADGDAADQNLIDISTYTPVPTTIKIEKIWAQFRGFSLDLHWDADTNVDILTIPAEEPFDMDWRNIGGLINNGGAGVTGDILYSESGMGAGDEGSIILWIKKRD